MRRALPATLLLPCGLRAKLVPRADGPLANGDLIASFAALSAGVVEIEGGTIGELMLADANVLRVALAQTGLVEEPEIDVVCENCDARLKVRPSASVELGPYFDGELGDEELDELDHEADDPIPPVALKSGSARTARLRAVTVADVRALHEALQTPGKLVVTAEVVRGLGVVSLGDETDAGAIASALDGASDEAFEEIAELFTEGAYPERLTALVRCSSCDARTPAEAPSLREFPAIFVPLRELTVADGFPDSEAFEARARETFRVLIRERGVYGVVLSIEHGVPDCDDAGNPLLGSYTPELPEGEGEPGEPPTIRLFSRTFRRVFADQPDVVFDEIDETVEHELDHHQAFLAGDDPEHEREQAELVDEARREVGETETLRRAAERTRWSFFDFLFRLWPFIALIAALAIWRECGLFTHARSEAFAAGRA